VSSFSPTSIKTNDPAFSLTVQGTNLATGCIVLFNTTQLATTYISPTVVTASVGAGVYQAPGTFPISVRCGATTVSAGTLFQVIQAAPVAPTLSSITPTIVNRNQAFTFTATGTDFTSASKMMVGTTVVPETMFISSTQLRITPITFTISGQYSIRVQTQTANGPLISTQQILFTVVN